MSKQNSAVWYNYKRNEKWNDCRQIRAMTMKRLISRRSGSTVCGEVEMRGIYI